MAACNEIRLKTPHISYGLFYGTLVGSGCDRTQKKRIVCRKFVWALGSVGTRIYYLVFYCLLVSCAVNNSDWPEKRNRRKAHHIDHQDLALHLLVLSTYICIMYIPILCFFNVHLHIHLQKRSTEMLCLCYASSLVCLWGGFNCEGKIGCHNMKNEFPIQVIKALVSG